MLELIGSSFSTPYKCYGTGRRKGRNMSKRRSRNGSRGRSSHNIQTYVLFRKFCLETCPVLQKIFQFLALKSDLNNYTRDSPDWHKAIPFDPLK